MSFKETSTSDSAPETRLAHPRKNFNSWAGVPALPEEVARLRKLAGKTWELAHELFGIDQLTLEPTVFGAGTTIEETRNGLSVVFRSVVESSVVGHSLSVAMGETSARINQSTDNSAAMASWGVAVKKPGSRLISDIDFSLYTQEIGDQPDYHLSMSDKSQLVDPARAQETNADFDIESSIRLMRATSVAGDLLARLGLPGEA